jgi:Response regulator of the LytR/AlgR family
MMEKGKIVIIDDHKEYALWLKQYLMENYFDEEIFILDTYDKSYFRKNRVDLLLLDIELGNQVNGIEEAIKIRQLYGYSMKIIFVSNHNSLIQSSLKAGPTQFVRKGFEKSDFSMAMSTLALQGFRKQVVLEIGKQMVHIHNIMYVESKNHDIVFHLKNQIVCVKRSRLDEWQDKLNNHHFIRCHQSYVINAVFIKLVQNQHVILENDMKINITRKYMSYFRKKYMEFVCQQHT